MSYPIADFPVIPLQQLLVTLYDKLLAEGESRDVGEWQSKVGGPTALTLELTNVSFAASIPSRQQELVSLLHPNLPWAEDHFLERTGGEPLNPPPSAARWPHAQAGHREHTDEAGHFSHTYPERLWPKRAGFTDTPDNARLNTGIRYRLGDLKDVAELLIERRYTRQAFVPIWFPEDTGNVSRVRVPCTLGYHAMVRRDKDDNDRMQLTYHMRSCDLLRHFVDDVYMAMRLCQWLCNRVWAGSQQPIYPGTFIMHIASLHTFEADRQVLVYKRSVLRKRLALNG